MKWEDILIEVGMEFDSISQFKVAIKEYANLHGFGVKFKKNDNVRCRVICQDGCEWVAYVSKVGGFYHDHSAPQTNMLS